MVTLPRFYCTDLPTPPDDEAASAAATPLSDVPRDVELDRDQTHHARTVLRLEPGAVIELFNGTGTVAQAVVERWAARATVRITAAKFVPLARPRLDLAVCLPKGPRADAMVGQLGQLGVDRLIPLRTARSIVEPRPRRLERFQRAAVTAAKQCRRAYLLTVAPPADLRQALDSEHDLKLIADPAAEPLEALPTRVAAARRILVLIGPEGGWTSDELSAAHAAGAVPWCFSTYVLRIETAAAAAAAILRHCAPAAPRA